MAVYLFCEMGGFAYLLCGGFVDDVSVLLDEIYNNASKLTVSHL